MKFLIIFLLLTSVCFAKEIQVNDTIYNANEKYSWKDFTGKNLLTATNLEGKIIVGSCFSQEIPDTKVFPAVEKLTLINCNTDNVQLSIKWIIIGGTQRRFKVQTDRMDWTVGKLNKPVEPIDKEVYTKLGISTDPQNLPLITMKKSIIEVKGEAIIIR